MSDEFLARIRAAATETPAVHVDRGRVLRAGRRRRVGRVVGGTALTGLLFAGTVTAVATISPSGSQGPAARDSASPTPTAADVPYDQPYGPVEVVAGAAEVDTAAGTVRLPLDEYNLSAADWDAIGTAQDLYLDGCFEEAGYGEYYSPGEAPFLQDSAARRAREQERFGVWRATDVKDHGYGGPMAMWGAAGHETGSSGLTWSEDAAAASRGCFRGMLDAGLAWEPETATASAPLGLPTVAEAPESQDALNEWTRCLEENDVAPPIDDDSGVLVPADVWNASFDDQVRIGLVDVQCKDDVDLVQRLADVEAAYQLEYLERGRAWVDEYAALQQRTLRTAEAYLEQAAAAGTSD